MITTFTLGHGIDFLPHITFIILFTTLAFTFALLQPYKYRTANVFGVALNALYVSAVALLLLSQVNVHNTTVAAAILTPLLVLLTLPHCVFYGYIAYRLGKLFKHYCCKTQKVEDSVDKSLPLLTSVETS